MYFNEFHNHKWAKNLAHARNLVAEGDFSTFYRGEDLSVSDIYPGMRVMSAYWISVEHEMKMRLAMLIQGCGKSDIHLVPHILAQRDEYFARFLEDIKFLVEREKIVPSRMIDAIVADGLELPEDWVSGLKAIQGSTEESLASNQLSSHLIESWFNSCLRSVANYNHYLIWGGVVAAELVVNQGELALRAAVDATAEKFKWEISREFYVNVLPSAGFEDLSDIMELGMRGMYSDQYYKSGEEQQVGEKIIKQSLLKNCELAGIYHRIAEWSGLPRLSLGYGICRYCEVHGEATMLITMPPMFAPEYRLVQSLGMHDKACLFELTLTPADDMDRLMRVHAQVFGGN